MRRIENTERWGRGKGDPEFEGGREDISVVDVDGSLTPNIARIYRR